MGQPLIAAQTVPAQRIELVLQLIVILFHVRNPPPGRFARGLLFSAHGLPLLFPICFRSS